MILIDTSVLIDYFRGINNLGTKKLEFIINQNIQHGICNFVYQELLQGSRDDKEFLILNEYLITQKFYNLKNGSESFENAAKIYIACRKKGLTIRSSIDLIICQIVLENDLYLLHNDKDFESISKIYENLKIF